MENAKPKSRADARRFRVWEQSTASRFVDLYAESEAEAIEIADCQWDHVFHDLPPDDWQLEKVSEVPEGDEFYPMDESEYPTSSREQ